MTSGRSLPSAAEAHRTPTLPPVLRLRWLNLFTSIVPGRGQDAELLHHAGEVRFEPLFHNFAVRNPVDVGAGRGHFLPRRGDALKRTGVLDSTTNVRAASK